MELLELKNKIIKKEIPNILIFIGEEVLIRDTYLEKIKSVLNLETRKCDSLAGIANKLINLTLDKSSYLYIVEDDKNLLNESIIEKLKDKNFSLNNKLILVYNYLDKRSKFYKQNQDIIVEFEKLSDELLIKYIQKEIPLNNFNCKRLLEYGDNNYIRIKQELNKIEIIMNKHNITPDEAFQYCLDNKLIHMDLKQDVFDFINSVATRNSKVIFEKLEKLKKLNEPDLKIISLLYTLFRNMFIVMTAGDGQGICERTGLSAFQIKTIREQLGRYSIDECAEIMKLITSVEQKYKSGMIEPTISIDYIITQII